MVAQLYGDDPEPSARVPAGLFVPVRPGPAGWAARLFRTPLGERTAVGFTSRRRLAATLGPDQAWIELAEPALRELSEPLGVTALTVDPQLAAPAARSDRPAEPWHEWDPRYAGLARATGSAARTDTARTRNG